MNNVATVKLDGFRCKGSISLGSGCLVCDFCKAEMAANGISTNPGSISVTTHTPTLRWKAAYAAYITAENAYRDRLLAIKERESKFPGKVITDSATPEHEIMIEAEEEMKKLLPSLYESFH